MATSGTYTYSLTVNQIITEALEEIQAVGDGESLSGDHFSRGIKALNRLLKDWQTQSIHLWTYEEGTLFLKVGQEKYDFRLAATKAANTYFETTTAAATAASALSFTVTSASDIQEDDVIGIIQSDNDLFWTTVAGVAGTTITVDNAITLATNSGAAVYNYRPATSTAPTLKPISRVLDVRRKESTDYEIPIIFESRKDYFNLPNKSQTGTPIQAYYSRQDVAGETSGIMYLWNTPSSSVPVINFTYERKIQTAIASTETVDIPDYAHDALIFNLAKRLIPRFGCSRELAAEVRQNAEEAEENMLAYDSAVYPISINMEQYG